MAPRGRAKTPAGPTPVEAIRHGDKRLNIPTADAQEFVPDEQLTVPTVVYERDPSLDPQLVWRGKYDGDATDLAVDAPPIYIQEKIDPRVLVENLRETARAGEPEPEATLFDTFDGLDEFDSIDFYRHQANWSNRMILGDSLQVMASLAEREALRGKVQMIYIDPPYGIKFGSNWQVSARKRSVQDGKILDAAREVEQIKAFRDTWQLGIHSYLSYLRDRLVVARELLTESGSIFVQIGDENVHHVRGLIDEVFGSENFISLIPWKKTSAVNGSLLDGVNDYLIWYARSRERMKYRQLYTPSELTATAFPYDETSTGSTAHGESSCDTMRFRTDNLTSQSGSDASAFEVDLDGCRYRPSRGAYWKTNQSGMSALRHANRLMGNGRTLSFKRYYTDFPVRALTNWWDDTVQSTFAIENIYVVQTYTKVIQRCMVMTTDPGDLVMDPTCGSGTTAYVAEQWGRRWITIDSSRVALTLARQRVMGAKFPYYLLADSEAGRKKESALTARPLAPLATSGDIRHGFVYERVQHITLKSIATNPDIQESMSRTEIDAAIRKHADFELLYDRPYEDKRTVRVSGPFTVESLSPHRSLGFLATETTESVSESTASQEADSVSFEQTILDNLIRAGIQNGRRKERIEFATIDRYPGVYVQAIGERRTEHDEASAASPVRVAIAVGPQYGTVSPQYIKHAAREAIGADVNLLAVLGFAFDAQAAGVIEADEFQIDSSSDGFASVTLERSLGRVRVLLVRMNTDLLMGEALKKTGAGNLFTVFGEPDVELREEPDGRLVVDLRGVDVYDPTTGEIRSDDTSKIALWMIDTSYNEESFFVRHCYFTGGNDPYKRLKTALRAEIDEDAWATLYQTTSRPFDRPTTGKIAVKVINDYGDEVMKVFEVGA